MNRKSLIEHWLKHLFDTELRWTPLTNDASFRKYYRVYTPENTYILMDAPPPENPSLFVEVALQLAEQSLSVPTIIANHPEGLLLMTDFGDRLYWQAFQQMLQGESHDNLMDDALRALIKLHQCPWQAPVFDRSFLERQWQIFKEWYLIRHLGIELTAQDGSLFDHLLNRLEATIQEQPFVFVHRDYHSRNLMKLDSNNPGILDFQDAMRGPITYDLVSLLQDCYIRWPRERVVEWALRFKHYAEEAKLLSPKISTDQFIRWLDLTGVQRHLKNLGIFSRLHYRDGKSQYLSDLPVPRQNILEACDVYPELSGLKEFLEAANNRHLDYQGIS